jgi:hypothetical protein
MSELLRLLRILVVALGIVGAIVAFIRKIVLKRKLEAGLGREVEKRELTDIGAWMKAIPAAGENRVAAPAQALKRKHGDVIALTLGLLGLAALALSIVIMRSTNITILFATAFFVSIGFVVIGLPLGLVAQSRAKMFPGTYPSRRPAVAATLANVALAAILVLLTLGEVFGGRRYATFLRPNLLAFANPAPSSEIRALATAAFPPQIGQLKLEGAPSLDISGRGYEARYLTTDGKKISYSVWRSKDNDNRQMLLVPLAYRPNVLLDTENLRIEYIPDRDDLVLKAIIGPDDILAEAPSLTSVNDLANNLPYAGLGGAKPALTIDVRLPPASAALAQKAKGKPDEALDRQVRRIQATLVETWFSIKRVEVSAVVCYVDPTTLRVTPKEEFRDVDAMEKVASDSRTALGKQLKDAGLRQFVIGSHRFDARVYQL